MVPSGQIKQTLSDLLKLFESATSQKKALYFSKLALLELCGWTEEAMDGVVRRCAKRSLRRESSVAYVEKEHIARTHGFDYDKMRKMLIGVIGIAGVERLERKLDAARLAKLKATLGALKSVRDAEAHTHLKGVANSVDAPSKTLASFQVVLEGLRDVEKALKAIGC